MSTELIQNYYGAFNRADWAAMLELLTDDVAHDLNQGVRQTGRGAFAEFLAHMDRCYREQLRDIVVMASPCQRRFAAEFVVHGTYVATDAGLPDATGQTYVLPAGAFLEVRDGRICRVTMYHNLNAWLKQVAPAA